MSDENPAKMMSATAGLHRDNARCQAFGESGDARWPHASPLDNASLAVEANEAAGVFAEINSENCNLHLMSPIFESPATITRLAEGAGHSIKLLSHAERPSRRCSKGNAGRDMVSEAMKAENLHYEALRLQRRGACSDANAIDDRR